MSATNKPGPLQWCLGCVGLMVLSVGCCTGVPALLVYLASRVELPERAASPPQLKADATLQAERDQAIQKIRASGFIQKIERPGLHPHVYVTPAFMRSTFDDKQLVCSLIHAHAYEMPKGAPRNDGRYNSSVVLKSSVTGRQVGKYAPSRGLDFE